MDRHPSCRVHINQAKPRFDHFPNSNHVAALEKEVNRGFLNLLAEGAAITVRPSPALEPVGRPYSIIDHKPSKEFAFGGSPDLPHQLLHVGVN